MAGEEELAMGILGPIIAIIGAMLIFFIIIFIALYVYMGFAFMSIAKKANLATPALAWIPGVGPLIITYQASKMHWWPWLLIIGFIIPIVGILFAIAFGVFTIIWLWKTLEAIKKPSWMALLMIIPIVNLVMIGYVAWSKE